MQSMHNTPPGPAVQLPVLVAAELQDSLLMALHDLQRLEGLLNHATDNLLARFDEAQASLARPEGPAAPEALREALRGAVTELQFHDMATQLIAHTSRVLQACAFSLASEVMGDSAEEAAAPVEGLAPGRPNPVTQSEMQAGSVELF
ncbi:hypothetical protein [Melaminivora alkalimesophila]|uniref:Uncharacterized protein n=1 Tax=Melaminivora alkalimesophila TaxID=1165852 RepID=A0A317R8P9_9BURK|nr:hypothetical protein [Melaminivora alkalimesophila]PWW44474.1 hypothetical protein DFR36_108151 [Melaminivora alkalimesophila]